MSVETNTVIRRQLAERRRRIETLRLSGAHAGEEHVGELLREIDAALGRIEEGNYGICNECHEAMCDARLLSDPLAEVCIECLSPDEVRSLEDDLNQASRIQRELLPKPDVHLNGWDLSTHYRPAGVVSGDYYDILDADDGSGETYIFFGDVSGKGVAASILMSSLHAIFRSLITRDVCLAELMKRANRLFAESTLPGTFATLFGARIHPSGLVEWVNAGHLPPLHASREGVTELLATGLPLGLFPGGEYEVKCFAAKPSDTLLLYTDGVTEARNGTTEEYGEERVQRMLARSAQSSPADVIKALVDEVDSFRNGSPRQDDLTVMALRRL